jgi:hypothetical protein
MAQDRAATPPVTVMPAEHEQLELSFCSGTNDDGYQLWERQQQEAFRALARRLGLPLGHWVEVILNDGIRLRGRLTLAKIGQAMEQAPDSEIELRVDRCTFRMVEVESCVRLETD